MQVVIGVQRAASMFSLKKRPEPSARQIWMPPLCWLLVPPRTLSVASIVESQQEPALVINPGRPEVFGAGVASNVKEPLVAFWTPQIPPAVTSVPGRLIAAR